MQRNRPRPAPLFPGLLLPLLVVALAAFAGAPAARSAVTARAKPSPRVTLRVMTLNIFDGGDELNLATGQFCNNPQGCPETLARVVDVIRASGADVVGIEEGEHNAGPIAEALGWYASERMQIVSRLPLVDPPGGNSVYIFVQLAPGRVAALMNVHLPSDPYGPYEIRDGATPAEIDALERSVRLPAIQAQLAALPGLVAAGIPVFLTGDFNSPSYLDWTAAAAAVRPEVRFPFAWPVSVALAQAGFRDSYRQVHPDPVASFGFTWTPGGPESVTDEVHDRIDWVLAAGDAQARDSKVVGEAGEPVVDIVVNPWPTDHRGVVTTFDLLPGTAPVMTAVSARRVTVGEDLSVLFHAPGKIGEQVALLPAGGPASAAVARRPTGSGTAPLDGTLVFATGALAPAAYEAALLDAKNNVLSRSPFWLYSPGTPTEVHTGKLEYARGEPIDVFWSAAPGMRWDWLAIYSPGESGGNPNSTTCNAGPCGNGHYLIYTYTHASVQGSTAFGPDALPGYTTWPLQPGTYEIQLLLDDGYRTLAHSAQFKVVQP